MGAAPVEGAGAGGCAPVGVGSLACRVVVLGFVGWYGWHHRWHVHLRGWLNAGLQIIADPTHLAEVLLGIGIAVVLALWWLPKWQAAGSQGIGVENRFDRENEARKTLAQIVAGVFVLAGLYSSIKTFDLQRQGQITDRYTKAIDQLGAMAPGGGVDKDGRPKVNLEVRLGGIYALDRISRDSPQDCGPILEVLTAYVRQNAPYSLSSLTASKKPIVREDIQAIMTVIGRYDRYDKHLNLKGVDLREADLSAAHLEGVDLSKAHLGRVHAIAALRR